MRCGLLINVTHVYTCILEHKCLNPDLLVLFFSLCLVDPRECLNLDSRDFKINTIVMLHKEITEKIIGCAMKVHSKLGNGFFVALAPLCHPERSRRIDKGVGKLKL